MTLLLVILLAMPDTIQVRVTPDTRCYDEQTYTTIAVDFKEYVKDVLPNEWGNRWHPESLKAGAVAAKQFALYEYSINGYVWSCNWDQVYRTGWRTDATDKAVDDTWNTWVFDVGKTYYDDYPSACHSRGQFENCMSQWESKELAENGVKHEEILQRYYEGSVYTLPFSRLDWNLSLLLY